MNQKVSSYHAFAITVIFVVLLAIGMANLYSAGAENVYFNAQLKHMFIGLVSFVFFGWIISPRHVNTYAYPFLILILICLIAVLAMGHIAGGGQRWLPVGPIRFQPSEFAKLAVVLAVAKFFYLHRSVPSFSIMDLWPVFTALGVVFLVIAKQPDLGTGGTCLIIGMAQLAFIRFRVSLRTVLTIGLTLSVGAVISWNFFMRTYQKLRILNLFNPSMDPTGSGYNAIQSLVAVGSGKQFGKGFLQGTQTQLQFLPARHTDFIFSVFAEEHGFWGCALVFLLFSAVSYIALEIAREAKDSFCALVAIGVSALILIEFAINVAMVLGIFPVVGMPLPFFSHGGTALITACISLGLLVAIDKENARSSRSNRLDSV